MCVYILLCVYITHMYNTHTYEKTYMVYLNTFSRQVHIFSILKPIYGQ